MLELDKMAGEMKKSLFGEYFHKPVLTQGY
jgi:CobQ-like glutamine amidotransferase family enzyme